jgi:hypothetical protein
VFFWRPVLLLPDHFLRSCLRSQRIYSRLDRMTTTPPHSQGTSTPSPALKAIDRAPITPPPEPATDSSTVGLCIAHYNEDLTWLQPFASNTVIYSKGPKAPSPGTFSRTVALPNIGRETVSCRAPPFALPSLHTLLLQHRHLSTCMPGQGRHIALSSLPSEGHRLPRPVILHHW